MMLMLLRHDTLLMLIFRLCQDAALCRHAAAADIADADARR